MKAGEKVSSSFIMAQMFFGAKIRQISYISKFWSEINVSSTKYSYISNQKVVIIEVDNPFILYSAAHSLWAFAGYVTQQGLRVAHPCLWSATPSEFCLLSPINTGVTLRSPPACGLPLLRSFGCSLPSTQGLRFALPCLWSVSPSGLLFSAERPIKSTILRAPQIDPEQTAPSPSPALLIGSNFGLYLV